MTKKANCDSHFSLDFVRHDYKEITSYLHDCKVYKKPGNVIAEYLNIASSFDIEVTSFFRHTETGEIVDVKSAERIPDKEKRKHYEKIAIMYAWVFTYDGHAFTGRSWEEFKWLIDQVEKFHNMNGKRRLIVGVHNLAYEFQFMRFHFSWDNVFAVGTRAPVYARTANGIEFRCTLTLSGYSLAKVGEHLTKYPCKKMVGDLDYNKLRHGKTELTEAEWGYIVNDGLIVCAYLQELIEEFKRIVWIPITKTGFVRKYLRSKCFFSQSNHKYDYGHKYAHYRQIMEQCTIGSPAEYEMLKNAFTGAIVHCNTNYSGLIVENVQSMDETSAYPTQIAIGYFPYGKGEWVMPKSKEQFKYFLAKKCCLMDISFFDIEKSQNFESLISKNKCQKHELFEEDNGRLIRAKMIRLTLTEVDYLTYQKFYKWKRIRIHHMIVYEKRRLPTEFVNAVLDLYATKTTLKGVEGKESEYMHAKENVNACYGACVTDICRDKNEYVNGEWITIPADVEKELEKYNNSKTRFIWYHVGVWVTSLARQALASAIWALGDDYIYSDTDSVKYRNPEKHEAYFKRYNAHMIEELKKASEYHEIPLEKFMPKTIKGEEKPLGVWDFDGIYTRFKSLGAKRYAVEYPEPHTIQLADGTKYSTRHSLTIAGVNKRCAIPYIEAHEKDFFDFMHFGYLFVEDCCGKNLHTYIDERKTGTLIDYQGNEAPFDELSSIHLCATTYEMTAPDDYLYLLDNIQTTYMIV